MNVFRLAAALLVAVAGSADAQTTRVDFRRDVQPIFREHCYGCHGPELQMNGFRLDRRADAMRGGQQTNIGPGNADGSRLYQRVAGGKLGAQMPPAGPLPEEQVSVIKQWIDQGAAWPDEVSGEAPVPAADPTAVRLFDAIRTAESTRVDELLRDRSVAARRGPHGMTPLMAATLYGDAGLIGRMLGAGADPNAHTPGGVTALMLAAPSLESMRMLLDAGADANARSDDGRSVVAIASGTSGAAAVVQLLLDYGADPFAWKRGEVSPLREAARVNDAATFRVLVAAALATSGPGAPPAALIRTTCGACAALAGLGGPLPRQPPVSDAAATSPVHGAATPTARPLVGATAATPEAIRAAVERGLPLLQKMDVDFVRRTGCVSCHHNSLVSMAVATAKAHQFRVDDNVTAKQNAAIGTYLESWRERALQNIPIAGSQDTMSYILFGLSASGYVPDAATDAQAIWLKRHQDADGHWPVTTLRPPIESNDIEVTAVSVRALQAFAPPALRADYQAAVNRARSWLESARGETTEERAFRLLGLKWAGASSGSLATAAQELTGGQRPDGGWAQKSDMASDAYATGQALVALQDAGGVNGTDQAVRKGVAFLLRTQHEDGTWYVDTYSVPIQPYFESGFPYGTRQWISAAGTAWAVTALALLR
jgi:Planctomycete cytochrome C/Ankyrin repeats (3 copies)/Squalene-hopene cyclase C-terminal domain